MGPPDPFPNPNPNPKSSPNCDPSPSPSPPADAAVRVGLLLSQEEAAYGVRASSEEGAHLRAGWATVEELGEFRA